MAAATEPAQRPDPTVELAPLDGEARPLADWVTTFHLVVVALDPFTHESAWIIDTASRILGSFIGADCRVAWLVTGSPEQARSFLGPKADEFFTFVDPDRTVVATLGLEELPAIVHLDHALDIVGSAQGWHPEEWREVVSNLAERMSWTKPPIPAAGDPTPYAGTPAIG